MGRLMIFRVIYMYIRERHVGYTTKNYTKAAVELRRYLNDGWTAWIEEEM